MRLNYDPFPLIFGQGDEPTKLWCLESLGLGSSPQAKEYLLELMKQQRSDGAFVSALDAQDWGMRETARNTLLLLRVGLSPQGVNVDSAVEFILSHHNPDGGWSENPALRIPSYMLGFLSNLQSVTWLTADIVELLRQVGMGNRAECQAAIEWLRMMQNPRGGWPSFSRGVSSQRSDPDATAQITFLIRAICGEHDPVYRKGRQLFESDLAETARDAERGYRFRSADGAREELDVYGLSHLLLSWLGDAPHRIQSGYDGRDPRVKRMMDVLIGIQREDGGWQPFWTEESCPVYTALAVKVLLLTGVIAREDEVKVYSN